MTKLKITITGGSGFIGTTISNLLLKNHEVTIFDLTNNLIPNTTFFEGSILEKDKIIEATKNSDVVIHLAAALGVINTEKNPVMTLDTNILGTKNVLEACTINNTKKIIYSSSSEIYGEPLSIPIKEDDKIIPITSYGVSKLAGEEYVKAYSKNFGLDFTIFRLFNVYGELQKNSWVIPEFVKKAVLNEKIFIHGNGSQVRAFCHVSDVAQAFVTVLDQGTNQTFNIGNNQEPISVKNLAQKIIELSHSSSHIDFIPFAESDRNRTEIMNRAPDITKAQKLLNYSPQVSLTAGLSSLIKKIKNQ